MRLGFLITGVVAAVCGFAAAAEVPLPRPRPLAWVAPATFADANPGLFDTADLTDAPSDCQRRLQALAVAEPMPRLIGPGACGGSDMVWLEAVRLEDGSRVDIHPAPMLRCPMAATLADWLRDDAAPQLATSGHLLSLVENADDYECRGRNRVVGAKLSEHAKDNAIDIRGFGLAGGGMITLTDAAVDVDLRTRLRTSACARFTTVLGPGSDGQHEAHIHLDLAERTHGMRICQWDVRTLPGPELASAHVPLPLPRPVTGDEQKR